MKKIFLVLMLLPIILFCQPYQSLTRLNSTITLLDSAETFTGNIEPISSDYNWIVVTVRSNIGGTGKVQFTNNNSTPVVWQNEKSFTYTAGDTLTNQYFFPITMAYFRVVYTNDTTDQTSFRLTTVLIKNSFAPITNNKFDVNLTGGATSANQVIHNTKLDSLISDIAASLVKLTSVLSDADSSLVLETARNLLDVSRNTKLDSLVADLNTAKGYLNTLQAKDFATKVAQDTLLSVQKDIRSWTAAIKSAIEIIDNAISGNEMQVDVVAALPLGDNNIGNIDIITLPSGNLGQQLSASSLSVTPATNIADATYIGDIKFGESVPAGSAIIGQVGIDQTTDGTTNKVQSRNATHDNFNVNANIQVGDTDVANGNPVPISDAGSSLTIDGSVGLTDGAETMMIDNGATYDGVLVRLTDGTNVSSLSGTGDLEVSGDAGAALALNASVDNLEGYVDGVETKIDSALAKLGQIETAVEILENAISGTEIQADIVDLPAITYGSQTLINAVQLDDSPTSVTSAAYLIGNKNKIGFSLVYDETEVGGVSGTLTLEVSPDSSTWYAFDIILDGAGLDAPNASLAYTEDATDYFYLPNFITAGYIRAKFVGTGVDADDTIIITVILHWQAE